MYVGASDGSRISVNLEVMVGGGGVVLERCCVPGR